MVPIMIGAMLVIVVLLWAVDFQRRIIQDLQRQLLMAPLMIEVCPPVDRRQECAERHSHEWIRMFNRDATSCNYCGEPL